MKKVFIAILTLINHGCVNQLLIIDKATYNNIPIGTKEIIISVPYSADSLFNQTLSQFQKDRCKEINIDRVNKTAVFKKYLESTDSQLFMSVSILSNNTGSIATYSASYGVNLSEKVDFKIWNERDINKLIEPVVFKKTPSYKSDHSFQYTLLHALNLKGKTIYKN